MRKRNVKISILDTVISLSSIVDLVSPVLDGHHKRVAYIASRIADNVGLGLNEKKALLAAALLHDVGALSLNERLEALKFDDANNFKHAELGYRMLNSFMPFQAAANIVRYHHLKWSYGEGMNYKGQKVPIGSHILHLADRIDVSLNKKDEILGQTSQIYQYVNEKKRGNFCTGTCRFFFENISARIILAGYYVRINSLFQ